MEKYMPNITRQYSAAASQAGGAVEKAADLWSRGVQEVFDRTSQLPSLPQVDLVPAVERYFDFVQRAVAVNRGLTVRWAQAVTHLSGAVQDRAESAGQTVRSRTKPVGHAVRTKADTVEQAAREQSAKAAAASRKQAEQAEQEQEDRAREARRVERERVRQARQQARARYQRMTKAELSDLLAKRDLPKSGNVDELVDRLAEADAR
jgi:SAP domain